MATKYRRTSSSQHAASSRTVLRTPIRRSMPLKQRLLLIYMGIILFCVVMLVYHGLGLDQRLSLLPEQQGMGRVVRKEIIEGPGGQDMYFVEVGVPVARHRATGAGKPETHTLVLVGKVPVSRENYDLVEEGAALLVRFQVSQTHDRIAIRGLTFTEAEATPDVTLDTRPLPGEQDAADRRPR